jgi:DNA-binding transcriptional MerR regulator
MLIGELAKRTGVSRRSLRYYEQHGLLRARRGRNGWRDYEESAVHRVRTIARMLDTGLTVAAIKQLEPCLDRDELAECDDPHLAIEVHRARLVRVDQRLAELRRHRDQLARQLQALRRQRISD